MVTKTILIGIMLVVGLSANGQCDYIKKEKDKFSGEVKIMLSPKMIGKKGEGRLNVSGIRSGSDMGLRFTYSKYLGCLTNKSYVMVKFTDGSVVKLMNLNGVDCGENPTLIAMVKNELELKKDVDLLRINYDKYYSDCEVSNKRFLIDILNCLKP